MQDGATDQDTTELLTVTAQIVVAHLGHNKIPAEALPDLIRSVHQALAGLGTEAALDVQPGPAVSAKRSIFQDYLVCLEDGAKVKMLKPYLQRRHGLTPAAYRAKWGLPSNYPMVAPAYAARRSALARQFGLGSPAQPAVTLEPQPAHDDPIDEQDDVTEDTETDIDVEAEVPASVAADDAPADEEEDVKYTAESVFANFGPAATASADGSGTGRQKRKRFSDQMTRQMPTRRKTPGS